MTHTRTDLLLVLLSVWAAVAGTAMLGCGDSAAAKKNAGKPGDAPTAAPREVKLTRVAKRTMARTVAVTGTLAPDEQVTVSVKVAGRLASIAVDLGTVVKAGQAIAQVEQTDYQLRVEQATSALGQARAQLGLAPAGDDVELDIAKTSLVREAQATLEETRSNLERARSLVEQKLIPPAEFDAVKATFVRAESALAAAQDEIRNRQAALRQRSFELRSARQQLADTVVRAPLDGVVQERHALAGEYLAAGASVATVVRIDPLRLRAEIPERDAPLVRVGQEVHIRVDGDGAQHVGRVVRLAPALNEQTRALTIEAEFANPGTLRPGSFAHGEIVMDDASEVPAVPASAVVTFAGIDKVLMVESGKAVEKTIQIGRRSDSWIEITEGVAAGDAIVVEPGNLQQGQPVTVIGGP